MTKKKLYIILSIGLIAGYTWLVYLLFRDNSKQGLPACFIKNTTGVPCPSCGNTRSVLAIIKGNFIDAILINPLGIIIATIMVVSPFWLLYDITSKKDTLYKSYLKFEKIITTKSIMILLIILILLNWIWNIQKGL
ncbi:MAG: hypothetical protein BM557_06820 [Flavobacterium sp. MedPE-SWcel]|uniref:DUF2752 domain-containing protein n=1 Tax=uncultured Flavobacterium sp. TaxID=165435 RepID=UPI000917088B|nr:DUF2752 domain-containing protein [uncultured Flavobacterium sp.]OIQ18631.1 MAG: hypothetical protein BM557_06820 [Flavobacterium sp. MedPE-SWcel]